MFPEWLEKLLMISFCTVFSGVCVIEILCIFMSKSVFHQFLNINFSTVFFLVVCNGLAIKELYIMFLFVVV